jgi:hypothetical protein
MELTLSSPPCFDPFFALTDLLHDFLGSDVVIPEIGSGSFGLKFRYLFFLCADVKDNLEAS